jgi:hypothetical protein
LKKVENATDSNAQDQLFIQAYSKISANTLAQYCAATKLHCPAAPPGPQGPPGQPFLCFKNMYIKTTLN